MVRQRLEQLLERVAGPTSARTRATFHLMAGIAWMVLLIPAYMWLRESIFWVIFVSHYANAMGHFSTRQGCRAESAADKSGGAI